MEQIPLFENTLTEEEAAQRLGFSREWLAQKRRKGAGPRYLTFPGSNRIVYDPKDLDEWLHSLKTNP